MEESGEKWERLDGFIGTYFHTLDDKGRLLLPSALRRDLGKAIIAARIYPGQLWLFPIQRWKETIEQRVKDVRITDMSALEFSRIIHALAERCTIDKSGRIMISSRLRELAGLHRDVAIVGHARWIEVWDKDQWDQKYSIEKLTQSEISKNWEQLFF